MSKFQKIEKCCHHVNVLLVQFGLYDSFRQYQLDNNIPDGSIDYLANALSGLSQIMESMSNLLNKIDNEEKKK